MLSRVADSIYWMNRYVERAENVARFVDVNLNLLLDSPPGMKQQWEPLVVTTGDQDLFKQRYGESTAENVLRFLTFDKEYPNSIISCLQAARENARSVREVISSEMWEQVNAFYLMVKEAADTGSIADLHIFFPRGQNVEPPVRRGDGGHHGPYRRLALWPVGATAGTGRQNRPHSGCEVLYPAAVGQRRGVSPGRPAVDCAAQVGQRLRNVPQVPVPDYAQGGHGIPDPQSRLSPGQFCFVCWRPKSRSTTFRGRLPGCGARDSDRALGKLRSELDYLTIDEISEQGLHEFLDNLQKRLNEVGAKIFSDFFDLQPV
jgi:hypothetical protein